MSTELTRLKASLVRAERQVELLCHGFGVRMAPEWGSLVADISLAAIAAGTNISRHGSDFW